MKPRFAAVGGALGGLAVWRLLRRKSAPAPEPTPDPAAELRAKLEESKPLVTERESFEEAETPVDAAADPDSRRRDVHDAAKARMDELKRGSVSNEG
jgi:acetyl-CoA carboxylase carboxyltransferase component